MPVPRLLGRRGAVLVVVVFVVLCGALFALAPEAKESNEPTSGLPDSAESTVVANLVRALPASDLAPAIVVVSKDDGARLTGDDRIAVADLADKLHGLAASDQRIPPVFAPDGTVALVLVPLEVTTGYEDIADLREQAGGGVPDGFTVEVTGGPAFQADIKDVFAGADVRLLVVTALVVALLLLLTYRSPWLWLVPLIVVAVGDRVAALAVASATQLFDYTVDGSTTGITSVLVFGAGTNYALLLIARYREELRGEDDRHLAMAAAWRRTAPAVGASAATVVLALLTLTFADTPLNRALGWSAAIGIGVAVVFGLVLLPAVLLLFGRGLFWPFVPRPGDEDQAYAGPWARIGRAVTTRPWRYATGALVVLALLAVPAAGLTTGLTQNERFTDQPEAVAGQETLARAFPPGFAEPTTVLVDPSQVRAFTAQLQQTEGVASVRPGTASKEWARLDVVLDSDRGSDAATRTVERLRTELGKDGLVGGPDAEDLDAATAAGHDRRLIIPLVLAVVLSILLLLLRSVVAAITLVLTVVVTYVAALGAGWLVFTQFLDYPALDLPVPLYAFIFLVALGVDYNIFLATRAREEAADKPIAAAMTAALAVTGGVITSAGIVLAAVFAVLGVLPLITLTQIGVIVGIGVLLDTTIVRSILVPALATLLGERFWWPGHPLRAPADAPRTEQR